MSINPKQWLTHLGLNARILLLVGLLVVATVVITTFVIKWTTRSLVEDVVGDQMVLQARIAAHLVAIAEQLRVRGLTPAEINGHLKEIARFMKKHRKFDYEFWITDGSGKVYLGTEAQEFTFQPDQPQASVFLRLLNGRSDHVDLIVQESRQREIDPSVYKYVGVSGVDNSRIVQVGYNADSLLEEVALKSSLQAGLVAALVLIGGFLAYYIPSRLLTAPLGRLIRAARAVEAEKYQVGSLAADSAREDEIGRLARVFEAMVGKLAERYESLVNFMRSVVIKVRGDCVMTFANAYTSELLGFSNGELVGQHVNLIVPPEWHEEVRQRLESLQGQDVQVNEINQNMSKTGERYWIAWSNRLIKGGEGQEKELLCVGNNITDEMKQKKELEGTLQELRESITERKRAEEAVRAARLKAEEATQAKSAFLATMSHEIRTPMNAVLNMTALALETDLTPRQRQYLNTVHLSARGLLALINDILDFSKIEAERLELEAAPFRLRSVLEEITETFRAKVAEKHVELIVHVLPEVPDGLVGDSLRIRQVLTNLIGNAFKFTDKGEVALKVSRIEDGESKIEAGKASGSILLHFAVRDTGVGIPKDQQGRLFQPFTQADSSTSRKYGGTGLGLAISRRLVKLMGGDLHFESEPGRGTTFFFTARLGVQAQQETPAASVPESLRDLRALVVEDTDSSRDLIESFFAGFAIPCLSVDSAEKGLGLLGRENRPGGKDPFGLVLLDWRLPGMNGLDAAAHIREQEQTRDLPIILMSSYAGKEEEARCAEVGVNVFLPKPITPSALYNAIVEAKGLRPAAARVDWSSDTEAEFGGTRVLLAEDNETNQFVALELLGRLGIELDIAANGREAVEMARHKSYAAVLMDMQMPEMDGLEATRQIRRERSLSELPIIAMTANAMQADMDACLAAGMNDFVSKPIDRLALVKSLRRWLPRAGPNTAAPPVAAAGVAGAESSKPPLVAEPAVQPPTLEGIDVAGTVRRLGIPFERLRPVLLRFADGQRQTLERLRAAVAAADAGAARHEAHALAGAAGNLGADTLRESARALELAASQGKLDLAGLFREVDERADIVFRSIESLRPEAHRAQEPPSTAAPPADPVEVRTHLERLRSTLSDNDLSGSSAIVKELLSLNLANDGHRQITRLEELIDSYEYDEAAEIVNHLLASNRNGENP